MKNEEKSLATEPAVVSATINKYNKITSFKDWTREMADTAEE